MCTYTFDVIHWSHFATEDETNCFTFPTTAHIQIGSLAVAQFNLRIIHPLTSLTAVPPQQMKDGVILDNDEDRGGDTCKTALHASHFCLLSSVTLWRWWCQETLSPLSWQTWKYSNNVRDISTASGPAGGEISSFQSSASAAQHLDVGTLFKSNQSGEHKTDRYLPLTWHLKTSPAGGGKARVSPAQCATATVSCLVSLFWHSSSVLLPVTEWDHIVLHSHRHFFVVSAAFSEARLCDGGYWRPSVICPQESDGSTSWSWTRDHTRDGSLVIPLLSLAGPHTRWGDDSQAARAGTGEVLQQANNQDNTFTGHWTV